MKKILLTTTALTMLAGAAVAQVSVSGDGRIGVSSSGGTTRVEYRYRVHFKASGETDGGLTFGAKAGLRWDESEPGTTTTTFTDSNGDTVVVTSATQVAYGASVWMGNGTMTVRVGNTDGAISSAAGIWGGTTVGFSGMSFGGILFTANTSSSSNGTGPNIVAVDFSLGSANVTISGGSGLDTEIAANFSAGAANVGIGYDTGATTTGGTTLTVGFDAGSANVNVGYFRDAAGTASWSLGVSAGVGAGTVKAYVANRTGSSNYGLGYKQSLGGGASLGIGYESIGGTATMEAGVSFGF
jgi:outer membrane protein OmpU